MKWEWQMLTFFPSRNFTLPSTIELMSTIALRCFNPLSTRHDRKFMWILIIHLLNCSPHHESQIHTHWISSFFCGMLNFHPLAVDLTTTRREKSEKKHNGICNFAYIFIEGTHIFSVIKHFLRGQSILNGERQ